MKIMMTVLLYFLLSLYLFSKPSNAQKESGIEAPNKTGLNDFSCGYPYYLTSHSGRFENENREIYFLNKTADKLRSEGFTIEINNMTSDAIANFTYRNESSNGIMAFDGTLWSSNSGYKLSSGVRAQYMALLGEKKADVINWICDGVLINRQWVLTAAHCFFDMKLNPNIVRLGRFNSQQVSQYIEGQDYEIEKKEIHPKFVDGSRFHDLALFKIPKPIGLMQRYANPICLPWGIEANINHIGTTMTRNGWGKAECGVEERKVMDELQTQEHFIMKSSECSHIYLGDTAYESLNGQGTLDEFTLCAVAKYERQGRNTEEGYGAPLTYDNEDDSVVLAGIESGGIGCAVVKLPDLYIPIANPVYLKWIKDIAFNG